MSGEIVVVGSLNTDLVVRVERAPESGETLPGSDFQVFCGGKGANQAYAAAKLGASVAMLGRIGSDAYGKSQIENLSEVGVFTEGVREIEGISTGTAMITVETSGDNRIIVVPGANGRYRSEDLEQDRAALEGGKIGLFQLETPLDTIERALRRVKESGGITILDPAPAQSLNEAIYRFVDYITPNFSELQILSGKELSEETNEEDIVAAARTLCARGAGQVIVKRGSKGALWVDSNSHASVPALRVEALDTTAAGDCFNGAFAVSLAKGDEVLEAMRFACAAAAVSVTRAGAQPSMPRLEEVVEISR